MPTYVVTMGDCPRAAALVLWTAQDLALARETKYLGEDNRPEYRWDEHRPKEWRLMGRSPGRKRFSWTGYAVHEVPLAEETPGVSGA